MGSGTIGLTRAKVVGGWSDEPGRLAINQDLHVLQTPARRGERNAIAGDYQVKRERLVWDRQSIGEPAPAQRLETGRERVLAASLVRRCQRPLQLPLGNRKLALTSAADDPSVKGRARFG